MVVFEFKALKYAQIKVTSGIRNLDFEWQYLFEYIKFIEEI